MIGPVIFPRNLRAANAPCAQLAVSRANPNIRLHEGEPVCYKAEKTYLHILSSSCLASMVNYVECPFCDRIFEDPDLWPPRKEKPLVRHLEQDHHKVRVRKGSNYKWIDAKEVKRRLEETENLFGRSKR